MFALWGEMKVTARMPHAGKQSVNSAISPDIMSCHALLPSIDVCSVSGPLRFVTLIASHGRSATESNWMPWRYAGRGGEGRGKQTSIGRCLNWRPLELTADREQRNHHTVHHWSNSTPLSRQNCLRLISDAWIRISKGWKTNTNSNLKFKVRKFELRLTTLISPPENDSFRKDLCFSPDVLFIYF